MNIANCGGKSHLLYIINDKTAPWILLVDPGMVGAEEKLPRMEMRAILKRFLLLRCVIVRNPRVIKLSASERRDCVCLSGSYLSSTLITF